MKKLSSTLPNMLLSLGGICVLVSGILAVVNHVTTAPIAEAEMKAKVEAIRAVAPAFDNNPFAEKMLVLPEGETDSLTVYPAKKGGALVGFAIESYTQKGFSGAYPCDGRLRCYGSARRLLRPPALREPWSRVSHTRVVPREERRLWYPRCTWAGHEEGSPSHRL